MQEKLENKESNRHSEFVGKENIYQHRYFHLSDKCGDTIIDFDFFSNLHSYFHPPCLLIPFNPPPLVYCSYIQVFFQKIPPSTYWHLLSKKGRP